MSDISDSAREGGGALRATIWLTLAVLACLSVLIINGRPLFYFDTVGYISQGHQALRQLGVKGESPLTVRNERVRAEREAGQLGAQKVDTAEIEAEDTVDGSRSAVYALFAGVFARLGTLEALVVLNIVIVMAAVWLPLRVAVRRWGLPVPLSQAVSMSVIAACFGSLPFFIANLMPDTFAPVLLLVIATVTVFSPQMTWWEIALAVALGCLAVVAHLSHLAIALLMIPLAAIMAAIMWRSRWWLPAGLVCIIVGLGFAEQSILRTAAKEMAGAEVVIKPYITARLIQDGPGLAYLAANCPNERIVTCKLYEALQWSDDPYRITASHIVFETSPRLGSFRLMAPEDQKAVAGEQIGFFVKVFAASPLATTGAFLKNSFIQSGLVSIDMTIPTEKVVEQNRDVTGLAFSTFDHGRLGLDTDWIAPLTLWHQLLYAASLAVILVLILVPRRVPGQVKALAVMVLLGILVNAFVCGGVSQPATRYGARVVWLLPMMAVILLMFAARARRFDSRSEARA